MSNVRGRVKAAEKKLAPKADDGPQVIVLPAGTRVVDRPEDAPPGAKPVAVPRKGNFKLVAGVDPTDLV